MDTLQRLALFALLFIGQCAYAAGSVEAITYPGQCVPPPYPGPVCQNVLPDGWTCTPEIMTSGSTCVRGIRRTGPGFNVFDAHTTGYASPEYSVCPPNSTGTAPSCTCGDGYQPNTDATSCLPAAPGNVDQQKKCADAKDGYDNFAGASYQNPNSSFCPNDGGGVGCSAKVTGGFGLVKDGKKTWTLEVKYDGGTCTPAPLNPGEVAAVPIPCKGQMGQVNGVDVCIPLPINSPVVQKKIVGSEMKPNPIEGEPPVNVSKVETTTCSGSSCSVTTSEVMDNGQPYTGVIPGSGSGGGTPPAPVDADGDGDIDGSDRDAGDQTPSDDKPRDSFCKENPDSPMCKSGTFSGSCTSSFRCDGDGVQCAIAREQHIRNCKLFDDTTSSEFGTYTAATEVTGLQNNPDGRESVAIGPTSFDSSNAFGAGSGCISDKEVTIAGHSVSIPFSSVCEYLEYMGSLNMLLAALLSMRILTRG